MTDFSLPLDQHAIHEILPHRYPFLFVDRIQRHPSGKADYSWARQRAEDAEAVV